MTKPVIIPSKTNHKNLERYLHRKLSELESSGGGSEIDYVGPVSTLPEPSSETMGHIYLVETETEGVFDQYKTQKEGDTFSWVYLGSTAINLSDYVTVTQFNNFTSEIEGEVEQMSSQVKNKADIDGYYDSMAVGSANTLAGQDTKVEDFVFKAVDCADGLAKLNSARGKSLVWNQMIYNLNWNSHTNRGVTITNNRDGSFTLNGEADTTGYFDWRWDDISVIVGHKYLYGYKGFLGKEGLSFTITNTGFSGAVGTTTMVIKQCTSSTKPYMAFSFISGTVFDNVKVTPQMYDLTLMFGAGNEPSTVAEFEKMFPLPYYDYNAGEIISNKTEEVKVVGFNQWDEEWEVGAINSITGENSSSDNNIRSKNYIKVIAGATYYFKTKGEISQGDFFFYDGNKNYISGSWNRGSKTTQIPSNCEYLRFTTSSYYGSTTYNHDICINLSDASRNGTYEPYKTNTIELNLPTLTGKLNGEGESVVVFPDGLKSAGSVYDEIVGNKAIKRVGVVDMGGEDISWDMTEGVFAAVITGRRYASGLTTILCSRYNTRGTTGTSGMDDKQISAGATSDKVFVKDSAYSDAITFKTAMSGVLLYYELATPEEYILDEPLPDNFQAYKGGTIKQLPENTSKPVTAPMVMTVTYAIDAVGTLVGLPRNYVSKESLQAMLTAMQSAGIITSYTMTYNESTGKYDFTFVAPNNS